MSAVSPELVEAIKELQKLPSLNTALLGGGTNLAIRYGHRQSVDIDLFFPGIIGRVGYEQIISEVKEYFGENIFGFDYPCEIDDQFMFLRFFIRKGDMSIKVEILQNMQTHLEGEKVDDMLLMQETDLGRLKLLAGSNRATQKDIFDLDYLSDRLTLSVMMANLKEHREQYNADEHRSIFDLDGEESPTDNPKLLLKFDEPAEQPSSRPRHSNPRVDIMDGHKNWLSAGSSWRLKVRRYFREIGHAYPVIQLQFTK